MKTTLKFCDGAKGFQLGKPVAILQDLQGPKIRLGLEGNFL